MVWLWVSWIHTAVKVSAGEGPAATAGDPASNMTNVIVATAGSSTTLALSRDGYPSTVRAMACSVPAETETTSDR